MSNTARDHLSESVHDVFLQYITDQLAAYEREVSASNLAPSTKQTYIEHPRRFARWLRGESIMLGTLPAADVAALAASQNLAETSRQ